MTDHRTVYDLLIEWGEPVEPLLGESGWDNLWVSYYSGEAPHPKTKEMFQGTEADIPPKYRALMAAQKDGEEPKGKKPAVAEKPTGKKPATEESTDPKIAIQNTQKVLMKHFDDVEKRDAEDIYWMGQNKTQKDLEDYVYYYAAKDTGNKEALQAIQQLFDLGQASKKKPAAAAKPHVDVNAALKHAHQDLASKFGDISLKDISAIHKLGETGADLKKNPYYRAAEKMGYTKSLETMQEIYDLGRHGTGEKKPAPAKEPVKKPEAQPKKKPQQSTEVKTPGGLNDAEIDDLIKGDPETKKGVKLIGSYAKKGGHDTTAILRLAAGNVTEEEKHQLATKLTPDAMEYYSPDFTTAKDILIKWIGSQIERDEKGKPTEKGVEHFYAMEDAVGALIDANKEKKEAEREQANEKAKQKTLAKLQEPAEEPANPTQTYNNAKKTIKDHFGHTNDADLQSLYDKGKEGDAESLLYHPAYKAGGKVAQAAIDIYKLGQAGAKLPVKKPVAPKKKPPAVEKPVKTKAVAPIKVGKPGPPTKSEKWAITHYTGQGYHAMRQLDMLDAGIKTTHGHDNLSDLDEEDLDQLRERNRTLDEYLARNSGRGKPVQLYRGAKHTADFLKHVVVGNEFNFNAKTSFTRRKDVTETFGGHAEGSGKDKKYPVLFLTKTNLGINVAPHSEFSHEEESLMPKNVRFVVKKVEKKGDLYTVHLEEKR